MIHLARINIYPIKSFDGVSLPAARVLSSGALEHDRRWRLIDAAGKVMNAKRSPELQRLRTSFDERFQQVTFQQPGHEPVTFHLHDEIEPLERWVSAYFNEPLRLVEDQRLGFPDDPQAPGPTITSVASLATVADWFPGLNIEESRRRFRANLELDGSEPFGEDRLFGEVGSPRGFRIGEMSFQGVKPCPRCPVPTRDSHTGEALSGFAKQFAVRREVSFPPGVAHEHFTHFYFLAVNTQLAPGSTGGTLRIGDPVDIPG